MLGNWDQPLLAYADRDRIIPPEVQPLKLTLSGDCTVTVDGRVAASWRIDGPKLIDHAAHRLRPRRRQARRRSGPRASARRMARWPSREPPARRQGRDRPPLREPLDIATLARAALASEAHFIRSFKREFGETPHRYLQRRRIERAADALRETDTPVTQIALDVGFTSIGWFSTAFGRSWARRRPPTATATAARRRR